MTAPVSAQIDGRLEALDRFVQRRPWTRWAGLAGAIVLFMAPALLPNVTLAVLGLVLFVVLLAACRRDENTVISVLLALTFLVPANEVIKPLGQVGTPSVLVSALMFVLWCTARVVPDLGSDRGRQPVRVLVLGTVVITLACYIAGEVRGLTPAEASGADAALVSTVGSVGLLLFMADTLRRIDDVRRAVHLLLAGGVVLAIVGELQFFRIYDLAERLTWPGLTRVVSEDVSSLERSGFLRIMGFAGHPIEYGVVLGMLLPLALHVALHARVGRRFGAWVCFAVIASGLPFAVSRSAMLTAFVSVGIYVLFVRLRRLVNMLPLAVIGLLGMQAAAPGLLGSIRSLFSFGNVGADPSIAGRTDDYSAVEAMWLGHPIFGIGPGTYLPSLYRILDNQYLYSLVTGGLLGLASLVALFLVGYSLGRRVHRQAADPVVRDLGHAIAAAIAAGAVASFTFDSLGFRMMFVLTYTLVGLAAALWRISVRDSPPRISDVPHTREMAHAGKA